MSARTPPSPRPSSAGHGQGQGSRPQSAKAPRAEPVTLVPQEAFNEESHVTTADDGEAVSEQVIQLDMPTTEVTN